MSRMRVNRRLGFIALASVAGVAVALVSQYMFGMEPCPWCILQRVIFLAIALACLIGLVWQSAVGRMLSAVLAALLALAGIASALWQHFYASASESCNLTLADKIVNGLQLDSMIPDLFAARASCADAAVSMLGVKYDLWSLALFVVVGLTALTVLLSRRHR